MTVRQSRDAGPRVNRAVVLVSGSCASLIDAEEVSPEIIGLKAVGLLRLPRPWVPNFFVVSGREIPSRDALVRAAKMADVDQADEVWVRSSGTLEGVSERGTLDSTVSQFADIRDAIASLQSTPAYLAEANRQGIHFVIQTRIRVKKKGHLSNERRLQRKSRDWTYEVDGDGPRPLGVRKWRNAESKSVDFLTADAFAHIPHCLRAVAAWVANSRALLEWVWDGVTVWVVQIDLLSYVGHGVHPRDLVSRAPRPNLTPSQLQAFVPATLSDAPDYPKLRNARIYSTLGYPMPVFYVLDKPELIARIIDSGEIPTELLDDLKALCAFPFVLRTDAQGLPSEKRQMLPRSDELRSSQSAASWLLTTFRDGMRQVREATRIILIGHHFIPAISSAWCQAKPDDRRARIESLWGIPEGLYCFAHDVFDVDTMSVEMGGAWDAAKILLHRERFKGKFVAPNDLGEWRVHETAAGPDWQRSIKHDAWVKEIAWMSRKIANQAGTPVVVMWFIGVNKEHGLNSVMPWYHEEWKPSAGGYKKAAPRTKLGAAQIRSVSNSSDWTQLLADVKSGTRIERVVIDPKDETIIRSREFVCELANHAKQHSYVIELSGGVLSHFYFMLSKEGCIVECVDLVGLSEEAVEFNKLVRDNIPDGIRQHGEKVQVLELQGDALITALKRKIVEEAYEVLQATTADEISEELADLAEVSEALIDALHVTKRNVSERQTAKRVKRGAFTKGLMLLRTSLSAPISIQGDSVGEGEQVKKISEVRELPRFETDFHIDRRTDQSGVQERQITMTLPTYEEDYSSGDHVFDLPDQGRVGREVFFKARIERQGGVLRLRVRMTSAAQQLSLPLKEPDS